MLILAYNYNRTMGINSLIVLNEVEKSIGEQILSEICIFEQKCKTI